MKGVRSTIRSRRLRVVREAYLGTLITLCLSVSCQKEQDMSDAHLEQNVQIEATESSEEQIQEIASALNLQAYSAEEKVTRLLQEIASQQKAKLQGLEHRLKTKSSTLRKLKKMHHDAPQIPLKQLKISDALRYTIEVADTPEGHYVTAVKTFLEILEAKGNKVIKVKNYWPKGDNYSGVNTILETPEGLEWELQFHTPASYQEAKQSHTKYEKLRATETSLTERQKLFNEMATPWEEIAIPKDVLTPHNLHPSEEIKQWSAPK